MGLFGSGLTGLMQDFAPKVQGVMPGDQPPVDMGDFSKPKPKGGLFGSGIQWQQIAGALGDALMMANGQQPLYTPMMAEQRQREFMLKRAEQQRQQQLQDQIALYDYKRAHPEPSTAQPYRWEDNAGNVWEYGQDGQPKRIFTDVVPKYYVQGDRALQIPNPYSPPSQAASRPKIGATVKLNEIGGGQPTIQNTSAPQLGGNGFPPRLTGPQYQAVVNQMGKAATDAWMARNNIQLGD